MNSPELRKIPSVDRVLRALGSGFGSLPRPLVVAVVRRELAGLRETPGAGVPAFEALISNLRDRLEALRRSRIQPVINGTGIVVHTNLGRAPLGPAVVEAVRAVALNYNNLEYDLAAGERGSRARYLEYNLALLCSAEAATVVNNCAAALVLMLRHFITRAPDRREVVISRGELIQIGGGFRIPEILEASGAELNEVGTTNHTALADYEKALGARTALILKVHQSNFYVGGFTSSPSARELAALARRDGVPFVEDLGSGALLPTEQLSEASPGTTVDHERTPAEALQDGVDLVCFSGDKLLGGPQAGIIAGRRDHVQALKQEPFFRALRCDKLILTALQATTDLYLRDALDEVPVLRLLRAGESELRARAEKVREALQALPVQVAINRGKAEVGGGTLPRAEIASVLLELVPQGCSVADLAVRLRAAEPPVIGYIAGGRYKIDLRTVFPHQDHDLIRALTQVTT
ncbi:MAG: L-seryl-tRNA(Sec) selenium transferase [Verrucomicrobia bacterium]|nr:L-seryl-tRNA(Sec) selenium transferase [Verrucomicrobiota bacterium]